MEVDIDVDDSLRLKSLYEVQLRSGCSNTECRNPFCAHSTSGVCEGDGNAVVAQILAETQGDRFLCDKRNEEKGAMPTNYDYVLPRTIGSLPIHRLCSRNVLSFHSLPKPDSNANTHDAGARMNRVSDAISDFLAIDVNGNGKTLNVNEDEAVKLVKIAFSSLSELGRVFAIKRAPDTSDTVGIDVVKCRVLFENLRRFRSNRLELVLAACISALIRRSHGEGDGEDGSTLQMQTQMQINGFLVLLECFLLYTGTRHSRPLLRLICGCDVLKLIARERLLHAWWGVQPSSDLQRYVSLCHTYLEGSPGNRESWRANLVGHESVCSFIGLIHAARPDIDVSSAALCQQINVKGDYKRWKEYPALGFTFCHYPFLYTPAYKGSLFRLRCTDMMSAEVERSVVYSSWLEKATERMNHNGGRKDKEKEKWSSHMLEAASSMHLWFRLRRSSIVRDSFSSIFHSAASDSLRRPLKVVFESEEGMDVGGVQKEFFQIVFRMLCDPLVGLFKCYEGGICWFDDCLLLFNADSECECECDCECECGMETSATCPCGCRQAHEHQHEYIGVLVALSLYNGVTVNARFPKIMFDIILHCAAECHDSSLDSIRSAISAYCDSLSTARLLELLSDLDPQLSRSLGDILEHEHDDHADADEPGLGLGLTFVVSCEVCGVVKSHELIEGGDDIEVIGSTIDVYVRRYARWLLIDGGIKQLTSFIKGFLRVLGQKCEDLHTSHTSSLPLCLSLLSSDDLELVMCGSPKLDLTELEGSAVYDDGFTARHRVVKWLWQAVHAFDESRKRRFLAFVTGSDRVPVGGLATLSPPFTITRHGPNTSLLPSAMTCANRLFLPDYTSMDALAEKLKTSLDHAEGFGLV